MYLRSVTQHQSILLAATNCALSSPRTPPDNSPPTIAAQTRVPPPAPLRAGVKRGQQVSPHAAACCLLTPALLLTLRTEKNYRIWSRPTCKWLRMCNKNKTLSRDPAPLHSFEESLVPPFPACCAFHPRLDFSGITLEACLLHRWEPSVGTCPACLLPMAGWLPSPNCSQA
jgi:hypothetical protein